MSTQKKPQIFVDFLCKWLTIILISAPLFNRRFISHNDNNKNQTMAMKYFDKVKNFERKSEKCGIR